MSFTIDSNDARTVKAVEMASAAGQWLRVRGKDGRPLAFGVPSRSSAGKYWLADQHRCQCPDFQYHGGSPCAHVLAVRLYVELSKAERQRKAPRTRASRVSGSGRMLGQPNGTERLATRYDEIFGRD